MRIANNARIKSGDNEAGDRALGKLEEGFGGVGLALQGGQRASKTSRLGIRGSFVQEYTLIPPSDRLFYHLNHVISDSAPLPSPVMSS